MSLRGTGQGGPIRRTIETASVLWSAGFLSAGYARGLRTAVEKWGPTVAAGFSASAARTPERVGLIDDAGEVRFDELEARSNAIAHALVGRGVGLGDAVGLLCRNHRGFVEAAIALAKVGANTLLLNTGFAARQLREVLDREDGHVVIYDEEFAPIVEEGAAERTRILAWHEGEAAGLTLDQLVGEHPTTQPAPPSRPGRTTVLTSGTTGTPKGARRESKQTSIDTLVGMLGRMPLQVGDTTFVVAPMFHSWGGAHLLLGGTLGCTVVMRRRFDPEDTLAMIERHRPRTVAVVPVMLQRILQLSDDVLRRYDTSSIGVVAASGSALPGELALRWMNTFGDNLYNFYGSTEVAHATIAMPDELRAAPGTAGRSPRGCQLKIVDEHGDDVSAGQTGRIFVTNDAQFEGYTGGGGKDRIGSYMSTGDVGYIDENGLLFVTGRDDEMIVSGGENVFPKEVEDVLIEHAAVRDAAAVGVPDEEFGQRLVAFVVPGPDASVTDQELRDYVKSHLARYKVPREVRFLDELPRNPSGKILKRVLREMV